MTLKQFFKTHKKVAVALSGGADSVFLMHMAKKYGAHVRAYFAKTEFQPEFELSDAKRAANDAGVDLCVIDFSALDDEKVRENGAERCYYCKRGIMQIIRATAMSDGYDVICDGTNASDDVDDRPGYRALSELSILSPLKLCGITKDEVRALSRSEGLFVWDKPAYACLATRVCKGEMITREKLNAVECAESFLRGLGFSDFRVRISGETAKLEICSCDVERLAKYRTQILSELKKYYSFVLLDMEVRDERLSD